MVHRQADSVCGFGGFHAIPHEVDVNVALTIRDVVDQSDKNPNRRIDMELFALYETNIILSDCRTISDRLDFHSFRVTF